MPFIIESAQPEPIVEPIAPVDAADVTQDSSPDAASIEVDSREVLLQLYTACTLGKNVEERKLNASTFAKKVVASSIGSVQNAFVHADLMSHLQTSFQDKKNAAVKEGMYLVLSSLAALGQASLPYLIPTLPMLFEGLSDKQKNVPKLARAALTAVLDLAKQTPASVRAVLPHLLPLLASEKTGWQAKVAILQTIASLAKTTPSYVDKRLPELIPVVSSQVWDSQPDVKSAAATALSAICNTVTNTDLHPFIPALVSAIKQPTEVPETVFKLAATTFVTTVEAPSLAIMAPILSRGLAEPARATLRQASVIVDNMCKLVEVPAHAEQFLPKLLPGLNRVISTAADPELREVATRAKATLVRVGGGKEDVVVVSEAQKQQRELDVTVAILKKLALQVNADAELDVSTLNLVGTLCNALDEVRDYDESSWAKLSPYFVAADLTPLCESIRKHFVAENAKRGVKAVEKDEAVSLSSGET